MSALKIEGIVLDSIDYDDFAKIVRVFSKEFGIISFYAPGVNKEASKNKYSVQSLTCSEFEIFKARSDEKVSKLKTGRLKTDYFSIAKNYNNYVLTSVLVNVLTQLLPAGLKQTVIYYAFKLVLENMKAKRNGFLNYLLFLLFFIQTSEYKMRLNRCSRCKKTTNPYARFEYTDKTLVCVKCLWPGETRQPASFISLFTTVGQVSFNKLVEQPWQASDLVVLHNFLINYLVDELGVFVGALKVLKNSAVMKLSDKIIMTYQ